MELALAFAFMAALGFGSANTLMRVGTQKVSVPTASFFAVTTSALVAFVPAMVVHSTDMVGLPWRAYAWFVLMGAMAYPGARVLNNTAIKMVGATGAAPFTSLQPLFAFALGVAALGERPDLLVALGTPTIVVGLALVLVSRTVDSTVGTVVSRNNLGYMLVAAAYALSMGAVMLLTLTLPDLVRTFRRAPTSYIMLCGLAGVIQGLALVFLFQALSRAPVTVVSPINASSPLITLVLAHFFLQRLESVNLLLVAGTLLSVTGVVIVVLGAAG